MGGLAKHQFLDLPGARHGEGRRDGGDVRLLRDPHPHGPGLRSGEAASQGHDRPLHGHRVLRSLQHVSQEVSARAESASLPLTALVISAVPAQLSTVVSTLPFTFKLRSFERAGPRLRHYIDPELSLGTALA